MRTIQNHNRNQVANKPTLQEPGPTAQNPTKKTYIGLNDVYDYFNDELFEGELPRCLITLQRSNRGSGYFSQERFRDATSKAVTDEIALNPIFFQYQPTEEVLSTLVHEMCHLWQHHFGKPSRAGYHNREWAEKMIAIGLMPSDTGKPGGKQTGQRMGDYIIDDGPFERACAKLISERGYKLPYWDRTIELILAEQGEAQQQHAPDNKPKRRKVTDKNKVKYSCPGCRVNVWGRPALRLKCMACDETLQEREPVKRNAQFAV